MEKEHHYQCTIVWTGNTGSGTSAYTAYDRHHEIHIKGKPVIKGSSDTAFRGDANRHNPEDMFLSALSVCHMLWYLHLSADNGIIVTAYTDKATGTMLQTDKGGHFTGVTLHPQVTITDSAKIEVANQLHVLANEHCFIANSCNFEVKHLPQCIAIVT